MDGSVALQKGMEAGLAEEGCRACGAEMRLEKSFAARLQWTLCVLSNNMAFILKSTERLLRGS